MKKLILSLSLSVISTLSSSYVFAMDPEIDPEIDAGIRLKVVNATITPNVTNLKDVKDFDKTGRFTVSGSFELSRSERALLYIKLEDNNPMFWFYSDTAITSYNINVENYKQRQQWNLAEGIPEHAVVDYFYAKNPFKLETSSLSLSNSLMETYGSCRFIGKEFEFKDFFIWPLGNFTLQSSDEECPIRKIKFMAANNQIPIRIEGNLLFNDKPTIEMECVNVSKLQIFYKNL